MTPPPYPPVTAAAPPATAAPAVPAARPVTAAPPATAVTSTQATVPKPPQGGANDLDQSPSPEKGTPLPQVSKAPPGYGRCWGLLRPEWLSNVSRAPYGPESLKEASPVPVQEEGFAADGSVPPPGSGRPTSGPPNVI